MLVQILALAASFAVVADAEDVGAGTDRGVAIAAPTVMGEQVGPADEVRSLGG